MKLTHLKKRIKTTIGLLSVAGVGLLTAPSQAEVLTDYITATDATETNSFAGNVAVLGAMMVGTTNPIPAPVAHCVPSCYRLTLLKDEKVQ